MAIAVTQYELLQKLASLSSARQLIAIVGAPASGKSTLAASLVAALNATNAARAAVLPMDGFHYDDAVLKVRGHLSRKGAPHTFDVNGLYHLLGRLRSRDESEVAVPVFDRSIEIARAGAFVLEQRVEIVIVEGNYLLLKQSPWNSLRQYFDLTVALKVSEDKLRQRLKSRWQGHNLTALQIDAKLEENDLPNGRLVNSDSVDADMVVNS